MASTEPKARREAAGAKGLLKDHPCRREHEQSLQCLATQGRAACTQFFLDVRGGRARSRRPGEWQGGGVTGRRWY